MSENYKWLMGKAREWGFFIFLFTVPIFFMANVLDLRVLQERYFQGAVMALGALFFGNIWLTLFMWLNIALIVYNGGDFGGSQVLSVFLTGVLFLISKSFFADRDFKKYAKTFGWLSVLSTIFVISQALGVDPIHTHVDAAGVVHHNETLKLQTGLFFLPAFNAIFYAITASLLVFYSSWVWFLLIIPVITARCSAAAIAFAFLFAFWAHYKYSARFKYVSHVIALLMAIAFLSYAYMDFKKDKLTFISRFESQHLMLRKGFEKQIGYGPDSFRQYTKQKNFVFRTDENYYPLLSERVNESSEKITYYSADLGQRITRFKGKVPVGINEWDVAHNEYLQLFLEYGYAGVAIFIGFMADVIGRFRASKKTNDVLALFACIVVFALTSITQFPFHLARLSGVFGIILGAYWAKTNAKTT